MTQQYTTEQLQAKVAELRSSLNEALAAAFAPYATAPKVLLKELAHLVAGKKPNAFLSESATAQPTSVNKFPVYSFLGATQYIAEAELTGPAVLVGTVAFDSFSVKLVKESFNTSNTVIYLEEPTVDVDYLYYLVRAQDLLGVVKARTRNRPAAYALRRRDLETLEVPVLTPEQQALVVNQLRPLQSQFDEEFHLSNELASRF